MNDELYYFGSTLNFDGTDSNKFVESTPSVIYGTDENGNQTELTLGENLQILDSQLNVVGELGVLIDDVNITTGTTYSSQKITDIIPTKTSELLNDSGFVKIDDNNVLTGETYSSNKITELINGIVIATPVVDKTSDSGTTFSLDPNVMYMFGEKETLTISLAQGESDVVNEYMFQFESGNVATTLNVPLTVTWLKDPNIQTGKVYQVSIENNLGIIGEWSNE